MSLSDIISQQCSTDWRLNLGLYIEAKFGAIYLCWYFASNHWYSEWMLCHLDSSITAQNQSFISTGDVAALKMPIQLYFLSPYHLNYSFIVCFLNAILIFLFHECLSFIPPVIHTTLLQYCLSLYKICLCLWHLYIHGSVSILFNWI